MGDGPFRNPRQLGDTPGRASYGGLAPMVDDMGRKKPKTSDPYFSQPSDGGRGRGTPFLDPPATGQPLPQNSPDRGEQKKWKPSESNNAQGWTAEQPYGGKQGSAPIKEAIGSKSKMMVQTRDIQRGSTTSLAIIAGTTSGVLTEPLVKGMGLLADKGAALEGEGWTNRLARNGANLWNAQFDPIGIHSSKIAKESSMVLNSFEALKQTHELDKNLLGKLTNAGSLTPSEAMHRVKLVRELRIFDDTKLASVLVERQAFLDPNVLRGLDAVRTGEHLNSIKAIQVVGGRMLTPSELRLLSIRQMAFNNIEKLELAQKGINAEIKWFTANGAIENAKKSFLCTAGTGAILGIDHSVRERMYGHNAPSWESSAFSVPLAIALGSGFSGKSIAAGGAVLSGHLLDNWVEASDWIPQSYKHFSAFDAASLGLAFAIPTKGKIARAIVVGTAVIGGNALESTFNPTSTGETEAEAVKTTGQEKFDRTYSSFEKTVQAFKNLGKKNEIVLEENLGKLVADSKIDWATLSQQNKLIVHRTTAAMAQALGEYHLEKGTRLNIKSTDRPTYILEGLDLDMGGDSLTYLQLARLSVKGSRALTEILLNNQVFGTKVTQQEIVDLDRVNDKVNADIEKITGKHDIGKAMEKLKAFIDRGTTANGAIFNKEMAFHKTFVVDIDRKLGLNIPKLHTPKGDLNPAAVELLSKLLRDQALAKLTHAAYKLDRGDDPIGAAQMIFGTPEGRNEWLPGTQRAKGFDGALEAISLAEHLSPENRDLPELKAIAARITDQIKAKTPYQNDSSTDDSIQINSTAKKLLKAIGSR